MNAHTEFNVYAPSRSLKARISRRLVKYQARQPLTYKLDKPIISITFDDCPRSVFETALPAMEKRGWFGTIYAAMGLCDITNHLGLHMSARDMKAAYDAGHEIGDHTFSHVDAGAVTPDVFMDNISKNQETLKRVGIPQSRTFAYPYGEVTLAAKKALREKFDLSRGIHSPRLNTTLDMGQTASQRLFSGDDFQECRKAISALKTQPSWLILFTHDIRENPSEYGCTPEEFEQILQDIEAVNADVLPVATALDKIRGEM